MVKKILAQYCIDELYGKSIRGKRGGRDNIYSWDLELEGNISLEQEELLNLLLKQRIRTNGLLKIAFTRWIEYH